MIQKQFDHVGLNVIDLEQSLVFYHELFGFEVIEQWDDTKQAFIKTGGAVIGLMEVPDYDYRAHTMAHLAFACDKPDFSKVLARIHDLGLEVVSGPKAQRGGESILFRDPSGNILEVCYPSIAEWQASAL